MNPIIFISHRTTDAKVADMLKDYLVATGIPNEMRFVKGIFTQVAVILLFVQLQQTARFLCGSCK